MNSLSSRQHRKNYSLPLNTYMCRSRVVWHKRLGFATIRSEFRCVKNEATTLKNTPPPFSNNPLPKIWLWKNNCPGERKFGMQRSQFIDYTHTQKQSFGHPTRFDFRLQYLVDIYHLFSVFLLVSGTIFRPLPYLRVTVFEGREVDRRKTISRSLIPLSFSSLSYSLSF